MDTVNVFLNGEDRDIDTAIMLENAVVTDIGNAVAYTDGNRVFLNTDDNLNELLPAYDPKLFKKWLLWHERYHMELRHHNRFYKYLTELKEKDLEDEYNVSMKEVNIIMDILVHDSLCKLFPELVDVANQNMAQMRNRNSLGYTFKTYTLEEMLEEYRQFKKGKKSDSDKGEGEPSGGEPTDSKDKDKSKEGDPSSKSTTRKKSKKGGSEDSKDSGEDSKDGSDKSKEHEDDSKVNKDDKKPELKDEHDKTDWSKLDDIDSREFITETEGDDYIDQINELKNKKLKLARLTETLNGLVTSTRKRTYTKPNPIKVGGGVVLKGSTPGRASLYLCFDASGSMGEELQTFKDIISKSIPQAMETPCEWFSGSHSTIKNNDKIGTEFYDEGDYYKGKFKDIMPVLAHSGYDNDGERTLELCLFAEQQGYSPIGVTDGGCDDLLSYDARKFAKQLKRTILVGDNESWLESAKQLNPNIQIIIL